MSSEDFGMLTLATKNDYLKAIGLAITFKKSNPDIPIAVACESCVIDKLSTYFDHVIDQFTTVKGFEHKLYLDKYTPFKNTLFLDSDIFVFRDVRQFINEWPRYPYTACGHYVFEGFSSFGFDRKRFMINSGFDKMVCIDGAGHGYFKLPEAFSLFERARSIANNYSEIAGNIKLADEDVINMVMTELNYSPADYGDFFSRYLSAKKGTIALDIVNLNCQFIRADNGSFQRPCIMHFAADEAPIYYIWHLYKLFKKNNIDSSGLLSLLVGDVYKRYFRDRIARYKNKILSKI